MDNVIQLFFQQSKQYLGTCQCKDGYTRDLNSCDQDHVRAKRSSEYQFQSNQHRSTTEEILIVVGIIAAVIIALVVFAVVMAYCGDLCECLLICFFCCAMCD